jgi:polyhydroxyalkanoate synthesis regulator phasin
MFEKLKDQLEEIIGTEDDWAVERAKLAQGLIKEAEAGDITMDEYRELMEDLIRTDEVEKASSNIEIKSMVVGAITTGARAFL